MRRAGQSAAPARGVREASNRLMNRPQFQRDIFPPAIRKPSGIKHPKFTATLFRPAHGLCHATPAAVLASVIWRTHGVVADRGASVAGASHGMAEDWSRLDHI